MIPQKKGKVKMNKEAIYKKYQRLNGRYFY